MGPLMLASGGFITKDCHKDFVEINDDEDVQNLQDKYWSQFRIEVSCRQYTGQRAECTRVTMKNTYDRYVSFCDNGEKETCITFCYTPLHY